MIYFVAERQKGWNGLRSDRAPTFRPNLLERDLFRGYIYHQLRRDNLFSSINGRYSLSYNRALHESGHAGSFTNLWFSHKPETLSLAILKFHLVAKSSHYVRLSGIDKYYLQWRQHSTTLF